MKLLKPYSDNIIFWDSEFSSLNPYKGELLSAGFVKPNGEELYFELEMDPALEIDPWVTTNVMPFLTGEKISRESAVQKITEFCGTTKPFLVAFVNQFDTLYLYKLLKLNGSTKDFPFHWIHVDFASVLFANGYDPNTFSSKNIDALSKELGLDLSHYRDHHALDDAKVVRDLYLRLTANE